MPTSKPLRQWLAASGADQLVIDPRGGWNEPTAAPRRWSGPTPRRWPTGSPAARARRSRQRLARAWIEAERPPARARRGAGEVGEPSEPGLAAALGAALPRRRPRLHGLEHADPRPGGVPAPGEADVLFLANRGANGIDGLVSSGIGAAHASGRPTVIVTGDLGLLHDLGGLARCADVETPVRIVVVNNDGGGIFQLPAPGGGDERSEFETLLGTPRAVDVAEAAALFGLPHRPVEASSELAGGARGRDAA